MTAIMHPFLLHLIMQLKYYRIFYSLLSLATFIFNSCENKTPKSANQIPQSFIIVKPAANVTSYVEKTVDSLITSIPNAKTVTGEFIKQETIGDFNYLSLKTSKKEILVLVTPFSKGDINKGDTITVVYSADDKTIKFISKENNSTK
jgi:hypothetical protein